MLPTEFHCLRCKARMTPAETHVRVPYLRQHWWQFGEERSEYRCPSCGTFFVLRTSLAGVIGYVASIAIALFAWRHGVRGMGALTMGGVGVLVSSRQGMRLKATS